MTSFAASAMAGDKCVLRPRFIHALETLGIG